MTAVLAFLLIFHLINVQALQKAKVSPIYRVANKIMLIVTGSVTCSNILIG